jgi:penicillin-binding protein 1A
MVEESMITEKEYEKAMNESLKLYRLEEINNKAAPYFTEYVRQHLMKKYGAESILSQGYKVYTTVRYDLQKQAEKSLDTGLRTVDKRLGWRGVTQHLDSQEKVSKYLENYHQDILEKFSPYRVLIPNLDVASKKLEYDLAFFENNPNFVGKTPMQMGEFYNGVVMQVFDKKPEAIVNVGLTAITLPLSAASWVKVNNQSLKSFNQIFKPGDVVQLRVEKIDPKTKTWSVVLEQQPEVQGALLSYEVQTGLVRAMVGGTDFVKSQFNRALHAKRQVGSTFKPLIYAAAFDKGFSPSSIVTDAPLVFKVEASADADGGGGGEAWKPQNFTERFEGEIPLRQALVRSMNIPTVKVLNAIGIDYAIQYARTLGITATLPRECGEVLE